MKSATIIILLLSMFVGQLFAQNTDIINYNPAIDDYTDWRHWSCGWCVGVCSNDSMAIIGNSNYLTFFNIRDHQQPIEVSKLIVPYEIRDIVINGEYAYIANYCNGLLVVDITDYFSPKIVCRYKDESHNTGYYYIVDICLTGKYAYLAEGGLGLRIVDISNPEHLTTVGYLDISDDDHYFKGVTVQDTCAYIAAGKGMHVISISDPSSPKKIGFYDTLDRNTGIASNDQVVLLEENSYRLNVFDTSNPSDPRVILRYDNISSSYANGIFIENNTAYITDGLNGLKILDISGSIRTLGSYITSETYTDGIYVNNSYAFVTCHQAKTYAKDYEWAGLKIFDVANNSPELVSEIDLRNNTSDIAVNEPYIYLADGKNGIIILEMIYYNRSTDVNYLTEVGYFYTKDDANSIYINNSTAFVTIGSSGLQILDISNPVSPVELGLLDTEGFAKDVVVVDSCAYIADSSNGLLIINISNPTTPRIISNYSPEGNTHKIYADSNYIYMANGVSGLFIIDVSNPEIPTEVGSYHDINDVQSVVIKNKYAYIADGNSGLNILDVSTPSDPFNVGSYLTEEYAFDVGIDNSIAYMAIGNAGVQVLDISNQSSPILIHQFSTYYGFGSAKGITVHNSDLFVSILSGGILLNGGPSVGISDIENINYTLYQNYPNPLNPTTTIEYDLPEAQNIILQIFDITGRLVETLYSGYKEAGHWDITWNASEQSSGIYIYRLTYGDRHVSRKMLLLK